MILGIIGENTHSQSTLLDASTQRVYIVKLTNVYT